MLTGERGNAKARCPKKLHAEDSEDMFSVIGIRASLSQIEVTSSTIAPVCRQHLPGNVDQSAGSTLLEHCHKNQAAHGVRRMECKGRTVCLEALYIHPQSKSSSPPDRSIASIPNPSSLCESMSKSTSITSMASIPPEMVAV